MKARGGSSALVALLASNTLANMAEAISMVAIPWFVLELTGSYAQMGIIGFFTVLPRIIAIFLGSQFVDRIGFRTAGIASDVLSGVSVCGIPLLYAAGHLSFPMLIALVSIGAVFDGPGATAREAMVPELARDANANLDRVNAMFQSVRRLSLFIGPMVAGFMVAWVGTSNVLWLNALVFALSAITTLLWIPKTRASRGNGIEPEGFWSNALFGFRYIRSHPLLLWMAFIVCMLNFLDAPFVAVQLPALVNEHYGAVSDVGLLIGANGIGSVIGSLLYSAVAPRFRRRIMFIVCYFGAGLMYYVLALAPSFPLAWAALLFMGFAGGPLNPILMSVRQERVPLQYRARVFGAATTIAFIAIPLGQLLGGFAVEWFGVQATLAAVATGYVLIVTAMAFSPVLHEMDSGPKGAGQI